MSGEDARKWRLVVAGRPTERRLYRPLEESASEPPAEVERLVGKSESSAHEGVGGTPRGPPLKRTTALVLCISWPTSRSKTKHRAWLERWEGIEGPELTPEIDIPA